VADKQWLTYDLFAGRVGEHFALTRTDGTPIELVLVETTDFDRAGGNGPDGVERRQFSLVFEGPAQPALAQATYRLAHDQLGELDLFLVPIGPGADGGPQYQSVFA